MTRLWLRCEPLEIPQYLRINTLPGAIMLTVPVDVDSVVCVHVELGLDQAETVLAAIKGAIAGARAEEQNPSPHVFGLD